ncbi:hypothetical protein V502_01793 [Pseudogymnoascus sp. VKM F-4520 (FW-2644)]|nr:hypothetical protein V502_01793 [Pseudogymnoascus sp. VKM F-4520 (FW-2644)]
MVVPVNESILYYGGWQDGPLYPQLNENFTAYPGNLYYDQGVRLDLYDDNYAGLSFQVFSPITNSAFGLTETIFDPYRIQMNINCVYPISGQYNTLSRALFYVLIVFSLVFRRHVWISVAALGTAMTYAAVSAVHLFALVGSFHFKNPGGWNPESAKEYMDIDILGIFPILTASGIMLTPILMWSNTVRRHHAQAVIVCWGALIFLALATCLGILMRGFGITKGGTMILNTVPSFALCLRTEECFAPQDEGLFRDYYNRCDCIDFCGTLSPTALMRKGANMVPYLFTPADKTASDPNFNNLFYVNFFALAFITINGAIGVLESYYSQSEVRNAIFRVCNADRKLWIRVLFEGEREEKLLKRFSSDDKSMKETTGKKIRYHIAKAIAAMFYLLAIFLSVICPVVFITSVVTSEIFIQTFPPSEHSDAIGAWGAWVGATLVILAAVIDRYSKAWLNAIIVVLRAAWRVVKYAKNERPSIHSKDKEMSVREQIKDFFKELGSPFVHGWYSSRRAIWTGKMNMRLFADWWKDTVYQSQKRGDALQAIWDAEETKEPGGKPHCTCRMCWRDRKREHEMLNDQASEFHGKTALDRARTLALRKRDRYENVQQMRGAYESVNNASETPVLGTEMSKFQRFHEDSAHASTLTALTGGMGESEESLYDRPATPPQMSGSRMSVEYEPYSPPAMPQNTMQRPGFQRAESGPSSPPTLISPHQVPLPEAAMERRSGYVRRDTDQSFGSFAARRDTDQSMGTFPRRESDQSMGNFPRRQSDQSMGNFPRRESDQSMGPITRRDTNMSIASSTRRKPVPSYIAPEGEEGLPWQRTMSPDLTSPRRDQSDSGS